MSDRLPSGGVPVLPWDFDDQGEWSAPSQLKDSDGDAIYQYRIQVCSDGSFDVTGSDKELGLIGHKTTELFKQAVQACEFREWVIRDEVDAAPVTRDQLFSKIAGLEALIRQMSATDPEEIDSKENQRIFARLVALRKERDADPATSA